jgi:hypothetical protein
MKEYLQKLLLISWVAVLTSTAFAQIPSSFFGMHQHRLLDQNEPWPVGANGSQTIGSMRTWDMETITGWFEIEHSQGSFNFSNLDALVSKAQANGADVLYTFGWTPQWAIGSAPCINSNGGYTGSPSPGCAMAPASMTYWSQFVTALVQHEAGKIKYYELWNEPNTINSNGVGLFWNGPNCNGSSCSLAQQQDLTDLVNMAQIAANIIAANDPNAILVSPGPSIGNCSGGTYVTPYCWLNDFFSAGGGQYVGAIAFHGYLGAGANPEYFPTIVSQIRNTMSSQGQAGKPLWNTESSQCSSSTTPDFVGQFELLNASLVARHYWYAWDDGNCGPLWSPGSNLNSGGTAYSQVYKWLAGSTLSPCSSSGTAWTCSITNSGSTSLAVWNTAGSSPFSVPPGYTQYEDLSGNTTGISGGTVTIGTQAILLVGKGATTPPPSQPPQPPTSLSAIVQ